MRQIIYNHDYFILLRAAAKNDIESLKAWNLAGADLNTEDYARRTALSLVIICTINTYNVC